MVTVCWPVLTKPFCFAYRQPAPMAVLGGEAGLAGQAVAFWQAKPATLQVVRLLKSTNLMAPYAADCAAVLAASLRQYAHPTSTTRPSRPRSTTRDIVMKMAACPLRG